MAVINKNNKIDTINNVTKKSLYAVIYGRVSTVMQDYNRQIAELKTYAEKMGYEVKAEFCEKISGAKKINERKQLYELINFVITNHIDKVLIYECSRLSRRVVDFLTIIEKLSEQGTSVYIHQNGLETLKPDGKPNPIAQLVLGILAQFNSMERNLIRSRMESGYNHYRANGGVVGRKKGYKKSDEAIISENDEVRKLLKKGYSLRNIAKITGRSVNTIRKVQHLVNNF